MRGHKRASNEAWGRQSAALLEVLVRGRIARPVEDLDDETLNAIASSAVPPEFAALDKIVKDWSP